MTVTLSGTQPAILPVELPARVVPTVNRVEPAPVDPYSRIEALLERNQLDQALVETRHANDPRMKNLRAVALLRSGRPEQAVDLLGRVIFEPISLTVKPNVPPLVWVNLATAKFMAGEVADCIELLNNMPKEAALLCEPLRRNIVAWEKTLSWWKWLDWKICGIEHVSDYLPVDFVPGCLR